MVWVDGDVMVVFFFQFWCCVSRCWSLVGLLTFLRCWCLIIFDGWCICSIIPPKVWVQHFRIANRAGSTQLNETPGLQLCNCGGQASCRTTGFFRFGCLLDRFFFFNILPTFSEVYLESTSPQNLPWICPEASWNPKLFLWGRIESQRNPGNPKPWERRQSVLDQVACRSCRAASRCWGFLTKWIFGYLG